METTLGNCHCGVFTHHTRGSHSGVHTITCQRIETTNCIGKDVDFPLGWCASSVFVISKKFKENSVFDFASVANPFTGELWLMIGITIVTSGLICCALERIENMPDERKQREDPIDSVALTEITFAAHSKCKP